MPRNMFELLVPGSMIRKDFKSTRKGRESRQAQECDPKAGCAATSVSLYEGRPVDLCDVADVLA